jgi:hypothetical protein
MKRKDEERLYRDQVVGPVNARGEELEAQGRAKGLRGVELHRFLTTHLKAEGLYPLPDPPEPTSWSASLKRWRWRRL